VGDDRHLLIPLDHSVPAGPVAPAGQWKDLVRALVAGGADGIIVGFVLCCSETHPLPYMPTRPFRVNAGALHSYTLGPDNRTNYLSEVGSGSTLLGVGADGRTRRVVVGRAKLESRPLLEIRTHAEDGQLVSLTVQDDWHVRVLGPGGKVLNVTELQTGDELLGYLATDKRHVGLPIGEFCKEV
jgi:3-amino-4-hydroxybenzoic acid synthase